MSKKITMYNTQHKVVGVERNSKWEEPLNNSAAEKIWDAVNEQLQNAYGASMYGYAKDELIPCPRCGGSGACPACGGAGIITVPALPEPVQEYCWDCSGTGQCKECSGTGSVSL